MKKYIYSSVLFFIIILALFFRLYNLSSVPPSPSLDEVTTGYNAYSILHTGKDEYGNFMPILLRAYDDWRPAFYTYLVVPYVATFGLSVLAVRLPSVLLSIIGILLSYVIVQELFKQYQYKKILGLLVSFLLAISPWHIYISRLGHEVNLGLTAALLSIYLFFIAVNKDKNKWLLVVSAGFFALSLNTYQSDKVFIPAIACILAVAYWKRLFLNKKILIISILVGLCITYPIFRASTSMQGLTRLQSTSAFSDLKSVYEQTSRQLLIDKQQKDLLGQIIHNRRMVIPNIFMANYVSHFTYSFLFTNGGMDSFKAPGTGLLYIWELPFLLLGIIFLLLQKARTKIIVIGWILVALIAPAITTQAPHAMRAYNALPMPQVLTGLGILAVIQFCMQRKWKVFFLTSFFVVLGFFIILGITKFYRAYFYAFPKEESKSFQYALSKAVIYSLQQKSNYKYIIFSNSDNLLQSYMFYLFYSKFNPKTYIAMGGTKSGGFAQFHKIGDFDFRPINFAEDKDRKNTLLVGNISDFPNGIGYTASFSNLDGTKAILAVGE